MSRQIINVSASLEQDNMEGVEPTEWVSSFV